MMRDLRVQFECPDELLVGDAREQFGETVSKIVFRQDLDKSNLPFYHLFPYIVMLYVDVFGMCMSFGIKGEGDGGGIITMENGQECSSKANLGHKQEHPKCLLCGTCK